MLQWERVRRGVPVLVGRVVCMSSFAGLSVERLGVLAVFLFKESSFLLSRLACDHDLMDGCEASVSVSVDVFHKRVS